MGGNQNKVHGKPRLDKNQKGTDFASCHDICFIIWRAPKNFKCRAKRNLHEECSNSALQTDKSKAKVSWLL